MKGRRKAVKHRHRNVIIVFDADDGDRISRGEAKVAKMSVGRVERMFGAVK